MWEDQKRDGTQKEKCCIELSETFLWNGKGL